MSTDPRIFWLRLARLPGVGPVLVKRLLETFKTPEVILAAHPAALSAVEGIGTVRANQMVAGAAATEKFAVEELQKIEAEGVTLLTPDHPAFPAGLKNIADPPIVLYVRGELRAEDAVAIGIVGARQCSLYGREQSRRFGAELAQAGLTIVSGGARGIDSAAHLGALQVQGRTVVVQGCGLRHTYPPENKGLYARIVAEGAGAVISEFALDTPPTAENFPPRNRIIAALSLGILVVEANLRSGSLITARLAAADYGREVFALPGPVTSAASAGTHHLIKTASAHLVDSPGDILENLGEVGAALQAAKNDAETTESTEDSEVDGKQESLEFGISNSKSHLSGFVVSVPSLRNSVAESSLSAFTGTQQKILAALPGDDLGITLDDLMDATGLAASVLMAELTILQIRAAVTRLPANRFTRNDSPRRHGGTEK